MNSFIRSLSPSKAADMLTNIVSPPTAGTSLAHSTVAIGGSARKVSSECQTSVPNGGVGLVVAELDELRRVAFVRRERMHGQFAEPPAEIHQILGADLLIAEDDQLVLDQRLVDHMEHVIG